MPQTTHIPLALQSRPHSRDAARAYDLGVILAGAVFVALFAQIAIPAFPAPITGQTFAVLLVGALLGARRGLASLAVYVAAGFLVQPTLGIPIFAGGGTPFLTLGYLAAFLPAAWLVGRLVERGADTSTVRTAAAMIAGTGLIFAGGVAWLFALGVAHAPIDAAGTTLDPWTVFAAGTLPYIPGALVKITLAVALLPAARRVLGNSPRA